MRLPEKFCFFCENFLSFVFCIWSKIVIYAPCGKILVRVSDKVFARCINYYFSMSVVYLM